MQETARKTDQNGFITIEANPISRSGVFQYSGRSLPGADPEKIYNVYRPEEELNNPETLNSFRLIPLINDHTMLGAGFETSAEEKGVHGSTGENVYFKDGVLYATLRIFSDTLKSLIAASKKDLSAGYRCIYEKMSGVFEGQGYDYIQRNIRGNHLALVGEARCDVAVLDSMAFDHFDLALDKTEKEGTDQMAEEKKEGAEEKKEMSLAEAVAHIEKIVPMIETMNAAIAKLSGAKDADPEATETLDADEEKEKEAAKDAEEKKEKEAMDSRIDALEKRGTKAILADLANRDRVARQVSEIVGTFDHSEMTAAEVSAYAVKKLGLTADAGKEDAVLAGYLAGRKSAHSGFGAGMDKKEPNKEGLLAKRLNA